MPTTSAKERQSRGSVGAVSGRIGPGGAMELHGVGEGGASRRLSSEDVYSLRRGLAGTQPDSMSIGLVPASTRSESPVNEHRGSMYVAEL